MTAFAALGRSLGDFGSQVAEGSQINLDYRTRLQNMLFQQAREKQEAMNQALQMQELQQRIRQMGQPQNAGIERSPTGAISGITWNPSTGRYEIQQLAPGQVIPPKITTPFEAWQNKNPNAPLQDWFNLSRAPAKESEKPDTQIFGGYKWQFDPGGAIQGTRDATGQYVRLGPAKEPGNEKTPSEYDQRITNYLDANGMKDTPANRDKADQALGIRNRMATKPVPPDIQNLLSSPVPKNPTAEQSRRLADAADRMFGGTAYKQDLMGRGRRSSLPFLGTLGRAPYASVAYDAQEYADILDTIRNGAARGPNTDLTDIGGSPSQGQ